MADAFTITRDRRSPRSQRALKFLSRPTGIELLRWLGVIPAAVLSTFVGKALGGLLGIAAETVGLVSPPSEMGFNTYMRYLIWLFPEGVAVVAGGAMTAPRCRFVIASVLAVTWILRTDKIHGWGYETVVATAVLLSSSTRRNCNAGRNSGNILAVFTR